jgi:hypothetical protein
MLVPSDSSKEIALPTIEISSFQEISCSTDSSFSNSRLGLLFLSSYTMNDNTTHKRPARRPATTLKRTLLAALSVTTKPVLLPYALALHKISVPV